MNDHHPLCKFCGERHPLLQCPEFAPLDQPARAKKLVLTDLTVPHVVGDSLGPPAPVAEIANEVVKVPDDAPVAETGHHDAQLAVPAAAPTLPVAVAETVKHRKAPFFATKPVGRCKDEVRDQSERATEPWKALGISRRTYYRRKKPGDSPVRP